MAADKGRSEQEQVSQLGCSRAGGLRFLHSRVLVGRQFPFSSMGICSDWAVIA